MLFEQIDRLIDAVESCKSSETSSACNKTHEFTITQCIEVLKDIPKLEKPLYFFTTNLFCAKEKREVFMAMDEADKLSWLKLLGKRIVRTPSGVSPLVMMSEHLLDTFPERVPYNSFLILNTFSSGTSLVRLNDFLLEERPLRMDERSLQMRNKWLREVLDGNNDKWFRMEKNWFYKLCNDLQANYGLQGSRRTNATEIIGMFLHILGHGVGNKLAQERFKHSAWTTCTYFSKVLNAICLMSVDVLKSQDPEFKDIPIQILNDSRYMPHFKDCLGAIDGVHVQTCIIPQNQVPFSEKWKILRDMLSYSFEKQVKIVIATMTLPNYIRRHTEHDRHFAKTTDNYGRVKDNEDLEPHIIGVTRSLEIDALRDVIAGTLMGL
ncbi:hypothetical protein UlMin_023186 [Ulmus minor]